jgi:Ion channel
MVMWAAALVYSGLVPHWIDAGYFTANTYTTLGYGDSPLVDEWRMVAPIIAVTGLFTFGWTGSVLVDVVGRIGRVKEAAWDAKHTPPAPAKDASSPQ